MIFISHALTAQDTTFAKARQMYHKEYTSSPDNSPSIYDLVNILGKNHYFTAVCPTNGGEPELLRNEGKALHLTPPPSQLHDWEPHSWQFSEEDNAWKALCPGDSVVFEYVVELDSRIECAPELDLPAWGSNNSFNPWWIEASENGIVSNGSVYTYLGADNEFNKPLILVEGFDFLPGANLEEHRHGGFGWRDIWGCNPTTSPGTQNYPIMLDSLHNEGYDVVFVDFENGSVSIEDKSILVKHVIRLCNEYKTSNDPNVLIGASMGGVVARHSLATMEQEGENHCCRIFAAIDSPHKGANISPGLQAIVHLLGPVSSEAAIFSAGLNSPAAKQLLHFSYQGSTHFNNTQQMLQNLGYPKNSTNLSIVNSHPDVEFELEAAPLLNWSNYYFPIGTAHLLAQRAYAGSTGWQQIASCALPQDFVPFNGTPLWYEYEMYYYNDGIDRDIEPSSIGRHMGSLVNAINASGAISIDANQYQESCGFISYDSALDLNENGETPFDRWHGAATWEAPEEHVELSYLHRKLLFDNIILGDEMAPAELNAETIASLYEYQPSDLPYRWIGNTSIENGGSLIINTRVKTRPCSAIIDLGTGGELRVGDAYSNSNAELILKSGSILNCFGENEFTIHNESKVTVESDAILILDGTTIFISPDASLNIEEGGIIVLKNGAELVLSNNTSGFNCAGQLLIEGSSQSKILTQAIVDCTINFNQGSFIETAPNSKLKIAGNDALKINIEDGHTLAVNGLGTIEMDNSTLFIPSNSAIYLSSKLSIESTNFYGEDGAFIKSTNKLTAENSYWSGIDLVMENSGPKALKALSTDFEYSTIYLYETGCKINDCTVSESTVTVNESVGPSTLKGNIFIGSEEISSAVISLQNCAEFILTENQFTNGEKGLKVHESPVILKCNHFDNWNEALVISGGSLIKMTAGFGGGYNHFNNNRLHIRFLNSGLPLLSNGYNSFGSHGVFCFAGNFNSAVNLWNIEGNSWLSSSLSNGSNGGELTTDLHSNVSSIDITVYVNNPTYSISTCPENEAPLEMNSGKSLTIQGEYDLLGREGDFTRSIISKPSETGQGQLNILRDPSLK